MPNTRVIASNLPNGLNQGVGSQWSQEFSWTIIAGGPFLSAGPVQNVIVVLQNNTKDPVDPSVKEKILTLSSTRRLDVTQHLDNSSDLGYGPVIKGTKVEASLAWWLVRRCGHTEREIVRSFANISEDQVRAAVSWVDHAPELQEWDEEQDERAQDDLTKKHALFSALAKEWRKTRGISSRVKDLIKNDAYEAIVRMSWDAVPFILEDLARQPDHWFLALQHITNADPVKEEHRGNLKTMAQDWIDWGMAQGHFRR